jgi:putative ABC transport system ATP-binding protein
VAIARALLLSPPLLVCDEPTGNLDADNASQVMDLFEDLRRERGSALVVVTHDPAVAARADRRLHLARGRLASPGGGA